MYHNGVFFICLKCTAWRPFSRGPTFSKFRYFQVFFGNKTLVNKIVMQKGAGYSHHPSQLSLRYSNDGYSWQTAETVRNIGVAVRSSIIERNASFLQTRSLYMYIYFKRKLKEVFYRLYASNYQLRCNISSILHEQIDSYYKLSGNIFTAISVQIQLLMEYFINAPACNQAKLSNNIP